MSTPSGQLWATLQQSPASSTTSISRVTSQQTLNSAQANFVLFSFHFLIRLNLLNNLVKVYICICMHIHIYIYIFWFYIYKTRERKGRRKPRHTQA